MRILLALATAWFVVGPSPAWGWAQQTSRASSEGFIRTSDGLSLYYRVLGEASDTVVVVHGGPGAGMSSILPHVAPLADSTTLIFFDQRGGGRSSLPADTTRLGPEGFVADIESVRSFFGLSQMKVIAHSFGAIVTARYLQEHPNRIERLILLGATGPRRAEAAAVARSAGIQDSAASRRRLEVLTSLLSGTADDPIAACREFEALGGLGGGDSWRGTNCDMTPEAVAYYFRYTAQLGPMGFGEWDFTESLRDVAVPVLVVHGANDHAGEPLQLAWARAFPEGRIWTIPQAGRGAIADRPDLVWTGMRQFLRGEWPAGAESRW